MLSVKVRVLAQIDLLLVLIIIVILKVSSLVSVCVQFTLFSSWSDKTGIMGHELASATSWATPGSQWRAYLFTHLFIIIKCIYLLYLLYFITLSQCVMYARLRYCRDNSIKVQTTQIMHYAPLKVITFAAFV